MHTAYFTLGLLTGIFFAGVVCLFALEHGKRNAH
ncbi:hypothetical protein HOT12_gp19 [Burkholderia phage vB_BmuP_KL4]|uniref:Uncharacterized protein n=1 Tax=Burkholderia phage vB_BmuP_KL4 TaxID=2115967 RepID=A0A2S1GN85_9CAUD|nr:hypothetical protein HOT12_gp19 [Burkholderia phage vB_BmuP_KL4]AWD90848.1 hypothetical protein [Burkholderia phage vB_BmuP_KL4]